MIALEITNWCLKTNFCLKNPWFVRACLGPLFYLNLTRKAPQLKTWPCPDNLPKTKPTPQDLSYPESHLLPLTKLSFLKAALWTNLILNDQGCRHLTWNKNTLHFSNQVLFILIWTNKHPGELKLCLCKGVPGQWAHFLGLCPYLVSLTPFWLSWDGHCSTAKTVVVQENAIITNCYSECFGKHKETTKIEA